MTSLKGYFRAGPRGGRDAVTGQYFEIASNDRSEAQVWCYTDRLTYQPGDILTLHVSTTAPNFALKIVRDGLTPRLMFERNGLEGVFRKTPADCSVRGCGWPAAIELEIPATWRSGAYIVTVAITAPDGREIEQDHLFVLRARAGKPASPFLFVLTTSTWLAYNDWGGSNHYEGLTSPGGDQYSPEVSSLRPWARGFVRLPANAPHIPHASPPGGPPRYPHMEWAHANGYSKKYASGGWACRERSFALWAEGEGIALDYATQHDLHFNPGLLDGYACVVIVGHDEYWSWQMRDGLDCYVEAGGHVARFAGNFYWQIRLEDEGRRQVCYKYRARSEDPVRDTGDVRFISTCWDAPEIGRPAALTMGLTGSAGIYAGWSRCAAHGAGGFTVYRPGHWALEGTGAGYGDVLGAEAKVFGYEVDGIDYVIRHGLPAATGEDGAPEGVEIIAMAPATTVEWGSENYPDKAFIGYDDARLVAETLYGAATPETIDKVSRGSGMIAEYKRGKGVVFNAGSCEWVRGLEAQDPQIVRITRNVLERFKSR
jgi:N,N-dimethylformamidase beta subunit-like, C-terminal